VTDADQQAVDNGQRQGKAERDREPRSRFTGDIDGSAQRLHASPHHVHADAAPGDRGHLSRRGEPRRHNEREDLGLRKLGAAIDQALLDGAGTHGLHIQAAPVVANLDQHIGAGVPGRKVNGSGGGFAGRAAGFRGLDAVIHAVADQMDQRIAQLIDDGLIQLRIGAFDGELDFLVQLDARS
jgi:hypothetical protein